MYGVFRVRKKGNKYLYQDCLLKFNSFSEAEYVCKSLTNEYKIYSETRNLIFNDSFKVKKLEEN